MYMAKIDLTIPFSLGQITLGQYQDYLKILDKWDKEDHVYLKMKILQIFCKMSPEDVQRINLKKFEDTIAHINDLFGTDTNTLIRRFKMSGKDKDGNKIQVEYGFIPKLDDISFGEYIDLETYISDWSQMEKAMAVLFRPITNVTKDYYTIEEYEGSSKHATILKDMPLDVALSATVFFYRLGIKLQKYIMDSLASQTNKEATQGSKRTSEGSGDGTNQYTHLHKAMLDGLKKSQRPLFINAL
mgnify:CR=1 FL=1